MLQWLAIIAAAIAVFIGLIASALWDWLKHLCCRGE